MKREDLMCAVGEIDEDMIWGAKNRQAPKRRKWTRALLVAACMTALLAVTVMAVKLASPHNHQVDTVLIDPADPGWRVVVSTSPYAKEMLYLSWDYPIHPLTDEMKARIPNTSRNAPSSAELPSVGHIESRYGIRLLRLGDGEMNIRASFGFTEPEMENNGVFVSSAWNTYVDEKYAFISTSLRAGDVRNCRGLSGEPVTKFHESGEYEIKTLGVTAIWNSALVNGDEEVAFHFIYGDIHYAIIFFTGDVTWACAQLETLHYAD